MQRGQIASVSKLGNVRPVALRVAVRSNSSERSSNRAAVSWIALGRRPRQLAAAQAAL